MGQPLEIFFLEYPSKKGEGMKFLLKGTLSFHPVFKDGELICLKDMSDGEPVLVASVESGKGITHAVVKTQWSFISVEGEVLPSLTVFVKPFPERLSTKPSPPVITYGGERRNNQY